MSKAERQAGVTGISRRDFLKISGAGVAGAALLGVSGCGSGGGEGASANIATKNLITGLDQEPAILNGMLADGQLQVTFDAAAGIVESPIAIQPDLSYRPKLAESLPTIVSEDPQVIEYTLREGLTWSDGEPLTSADARWTYEQIIDPDNEIATRLGWEDIGSFDTPDERTVRITFDTPYAPWRDLFSDSWPIYPKHVYEGEDFNSALNDSIVGSGPFKFQEWQKGQELTVVRNENYWGPKPALESVTYRFITDTNTLITSLQAGEINFINPPPDIGLQGRLEGVPGTTIDVATGGVIWEAIHFQTGNVSNRKMRQAIAYGINRPQVVDQILQGTVGTLESVLIPQQEPFYTPAWDRYTYDPDRAKQLVKEASSEGASTTITFSTTAGNNLRETLQEIVQQQLEQVGITVEISNESATTYFSKTTVNGDFEMGEWAWVATPEAQLSELFSASNVPPEGQNYYRYKSQSATEAMEQADRTIDEAERARLLQQAQEQMAEDVPVIPMYQRPVTITYSPNLKGPESNPSLAGVYWNMGDWTV